MASSLNFSQLIRLVVVITISAEIASANPTFDRAAFLQLSAQQKEDMVLAFLADRDRLLDNIDYKLHATTINIDVETRARRYLHDDEFVFRRKGSQLWTHVINYNWGDPKSVRVEYTTSWDGRAGKGLVPASYMHSSNAQGSILSRENITFSETQFNQLLGIRIRLPIRTPDQSSVIDWLRALPRSAYKVSVDLSSENGDECVKTSVDSQVRNSSNHWEFVQDGNRDFAIARFNYSYKSGATYIKNTVEAKHFQRVSGIWVPDDVLTLVGNSAAKEETETSYKLLSFDVGHLSPEDLDVRFSPGTRVVDRVRTIAYTVLPNGQYRLEPLAEKSAGVLHMPPHGELRTVPSIDESTKRQYVTTGLLTVAPSYAKGKWTNLRTIAFICANLIVAGLIFLLWKKGRVIRAVPSNQEDRSP
jgi:hypothetical protein